MSAPDVDEEILSELFVLLDDGTPDGLITACDMFLVGVPTALADVRRALSESRVADAGKMAHTLRGTAGAFGATRLGRLAASLEDVCGRTDGASADALVDGMEAEFLAFRTILTVAPGGANARLTPVRAGPVRRSEDSRASRARPADGPPSHAIWVSTWTPKAPLASRARAAASAIWWAPSNRIARSAGTVSSAPISPRAQMAWTRRATGTVVEAGEEGPDGAGRAHAAQAAGGPGPYLHRRVVLEEAEDVVGRGQGLEPAQHLHGHGPGGDGSAPQALAQDRHRAGADLEDGVGHHVDGEGPRPLRVTPGAARGRQGRPDGPDHGRPTTGPGGCGRAGGRAGRGWRRRSRCRPGSRRPADEPRPVSSGCRAGRSRPRRPHRRAGRRAAPCPGPARWAAGRGRGRRAPAAGKA